MREGGTRGRAPAGGADGPIRRKFLTQNRLLDPAEVRTRFQAELVDEVLAEPSVGLERLGLSAAAGQGLHQLPLTALPERGGGHQRLQLGHQLTVVAQGELAVDPVLHGESADLLETEQLGNGNGIVIETRQRRSPPERESLVQQGTARGRVTGGPRPVDQALEPGDVGAARDRARGRTRPSA